MKVEVLFGGRIRFATIEALAEARGPVTAWQISLMKGLDPAATYRCLGEMSKFGVVKSEKKGRNQTFYRLSDGAGRAAARFLKSLKQGAGQVEDLDTWMSPRMRSERMAKIVRLDRTDTAKFRSLMARKNTGIMSRRKRGELSALVAASKIAFDELFEQKGRKYILKAG